MFSRNCAIAKYWKVPAVKITNSRKEKKMRIRGRMREGMRGNESMKQGDRKRKRSRGKER